jgi:hypothetical protein
MMVVEKIKPGAVAIQFLQLEHSLAEPGSPERRRIRDLNRIIEAARKAAGGAQDAGLTALKLGNSPMGILIGKHLAGAEELMAAQEIEAAWMAKTGALWLKPISLEKRDRGHESADWSWQTTELVGRYDKFANHWSDRRKQDGNPMLEIVVAAVVDMRGFRQIEQDMRLRNGSAPKIVIAGLRDYAARARWVDHQLTAKWKAEAGSLHKASRPKVLLSMAVERAGR